MKLLGSDALALKIECWYCELTLNILEERLIGSVRVFLVELAALKILAISLSRLLVSFALLKT